MVTNNSGTAKNSQNGGGPNTGLIAGLTTGLVCAALIALTAGLLIYRKRKRAHMTDINNKSASLESPASPHTEIVMTAPTFSKIKVPPISAPAPAATVPIATSDHYQDQTLYNIGSPLFIPSLRATTSTINEPTTTGTTIQRSLTLSGRPQYNPSRTLAGNNNGTSIQNNAASSPLNRSSSVKVTKYDYNPPLLDDDDLDHVQIRRAISVKRRNAAAHSAYMAHQASATPLISVARSTSLRSKNTNSRLYDDEPNSAKLPPTAYDDKEDNNINKANDNGNDTDDKDDDSLNENVATGANSGAIQVVCAKPTIARIRSISRKDSTGKKRAKVVEEHDKSSQQATVSDSSSSSHLTLPQPKQSERMSMRSMPDSTHSSLMADGEITVYWQPPSN